MPVKHVVDARADREGDITQVKFRENQRFTPASQAMPMADRGEVDNMHVVRRDGAKPHLRTNPDHKKSNNLDEMAKRSKRRK